MNEVKKQSKSNVFFIVIILILLVVIGCLTSYIFLNKDNSSVNKYVTENGNKNSEKENISEDCKSNINVPEEKNDSVLVFDSSKSLNSTEKNYTLSCQGNAGIWVTVDSTQKQLTFSFAPAKVVQYYQLNWSSTSYNLKSDIIKFDKKIMDVFFGSMGQTSSGDTLFILLEDGTVEYIPIVHMFNNSQAAPISYGKINGVTGVTKFVLSSTSGSVTTLAVKSDGSFYDMWYSLKNTGNY